MSTPCRNCTDRVVGCHSKCAKYAEWRKHYEIASIERAKLRPAREFRDDGKYKGFKTYKMPKQKGGR